MSTMARIGGRWLRRLRVSLVALTISSVPVVYLFANAPFLKETFEWRYKVSSEIPTELRRIIDSEYNYYVTTDERFRKRKKVYFYSSTSEDNLDTVVQGALNSPFGARLALPFYAQFCSIDEAYDYCRNNLEPMNFMGETACVVWDSPIGRQIVETFYLSDEAKRFLVSRDLFANESLKNLTLFPFYWCCYTSLAFIFAHMISQYFFADKLVSYFGLAALLNSPAWWCSLQNAKFDWYTTDQAADIDAARLSVEHGRGGKEYYQKMLKRNRLLREMTEHGKESVSAVGDPRNSVTSVWARYNSLVDLDAENELLDKIREVGDS